MLIRRRVTLPQYLGTRVRYDTYGIRQRPSQSARRPYEIVAESSALGVWSELTFHSFDTKKLSTTLAKRRHAIHVIWAMDPNDAHPSNL
jgi:hypothetical protein